MKSNREYTDYLQDILDAATKAIREDLWIRSQTRNLSKACEKRNRS